MTTDKDQYKVHKEPFYQAQGKEVELYTPPMLPACR